jgi:hypothetical protein
MAIHASGDEQPGPDGEKPASMWMAEDGLSIVCPFCGEAKQSDDRLGRHLVHYHWREIDYATKQVRTMLR